MTVWMTLLVTVDRYVAVCQPWRVADFATHRRHTRLAVCFVLLTAVLYNIPRYFERQVHIRHYTAASPGISVRAA